MMKKKMMMMMMMKILTDKMMQKMQKMMKLMMWKKMMMRTIEGKVVVKIFLFLVNLAQIRVLAKQKREVLNMRKGTT